MLVLTFNFATAGMLTFRTLAFLFQFAGLGITGILAIYIVEHFSLEVCAAGLGTI